GGPLGVAHDDPVVARLLGNDLADGGEVHDERAMAPEEGPGIERSFELGERPRNEVAVSAGAREDELAVGFEPQNLPGREQVNARPALTRDPVRGRKGARSLTRGVPRRTRMGVRVARGCSRVR